MNILVTYQVMAFMAVIEQAGIPALRVAFTIAVIVFLFGGYVIFRKRHQFFDRDPTFRTMCQSSDTIVWKKSYLFGAD
jgi:cytochrome b561